MRSIHRLEGILGTPLVNRQRGNVSLTPAGQTLAKRAKDILESVDDALTASRAAAIDKRRLHIGFIEYAYALIAPTGLEAFAQRVPEINIEPLNQRGHRTDDAVLSGAMELAFAGGGSDPDGDNWANGVKVMRIVTEPLAVIVTPYHWLANASATSLEQLAGERFIVFARDQAPAVYDNVRCAFQDSLISPRIELEVCLLETMLNGIRARSGVGIAPLSVRRHNFRGLALIPLAGPRAPAVSLLLLWRSCDERPAYHDFARWMADNIKIESPDIIGGGFIPTLLEAGHARK